MKVVKFLETIVWGIAYIISVAVIGAVLVSVFYSEAECNAALEAVIQWIKTCF